MSTFSAPGQEAHRIKSEQARLIKDHLIEPVRVLARPRPTDIVAVIVARNEALRLPDCLNHYRRLGVKRFAIIDNGSTDESQDFLLTQPDVDIFYIHSGYPQARSGCYWRVRLFDQYGFNRWYISVDADELLVYDGMEKHDIYDLAANLTHRGAKSLFAPMIDMYADRPFYELSYRPGDSMIATCQFFDGDSYALTPLPEGIPWITGGPRDRITPGASDADLHNLSKFPFFSGTRHHIVCTITILAPLGIGRSLAGYCYISKCFRISLKRLMRLLKKRPVGRTPNSIIATKAVSTTGGSFRLSMKAAVTIRGRSHSLSAV